MNLIRLFFLTAALAVFLVSACADRRVVPDTHIPPNSVPQIGGPSREDTRVASRPATGPKSRPDVISPRKERPEALTRMIRKAKGQLDRNQAEAAFATLEQALSIDGQDPLVWHLMAKVRLSQGRYRQAVSLAKKSDSLAASYPDLKKKNANLIRKAQGG